MAPPEEPAPEASARQVNDLFESPELAKAVETEEFRVFLDHIPIAIVVCKSVHDEQRRIVYANKALEDLTGLIAVDIMGRGWSILEPFKLEDEPHVALSEAILQGEDFVGTFLRKEPDTKLVEAYASLVEDDDSAKAYRIVALVDVTERERAQREEFARQIRDKDTMLKELQHRVRNNLQLVTALIRLEARNERRGDKVNLSALAGRIESLQLLYQSMSAVPLGDDIELGHYIGQIASAVMSSHGVDGIRLDLKIDHAVASVNVAMPIGLIVNELLTNAFKHAFCGSGTGVILLECLHESDDRYRVVVADDGVGLPPDIKWPMPGKIGALIVQTLHENTRADLKVESAPGQGTRVTLAFTPHAPKPKLPH